MNQQVHCRQNQNAINVDLIVVLGGYWHDQYGRLVDCPFGNMWRSAAMCITILFTKLGVFQELVAEAAEFAFIHDATLSLDCVNQFRSSRNYNV